MRMRNNVTNGIACEYRDEFTLPFFPFFLSFARAIHFVTLAFAWQRERRRGGDRHG